MNRRGFLARLLGAVPAASALAAILRTPLLAEACAKSEGVATRRGRPFTQADCRLLAREWAREMQLAPHEEQRIISSAEFGQPELYE